MDRVEAALTKVIIIKYNQKYMKLQPHILHAVIFVLPDHRQSKCKSHGFKFNAHNI